MTNKEVDLHIIGWLNVPHSFAIVNQYQIRDLRKESFLLSHESAPFLRPEWTTSTTQGLFSGLGGFEALPSCPASNPPDFIYTIFYPFDLKPRAAKRKTFVFAVNEYQEISTKTRNGDLHSALSRTDYLVVTPSSWSKHGYLKYGFKEEQVAVIPHGYDSDLFFPKFNEESFALLQYQHDPSLFYFGSLGTMTYNKGVDLLLRAFFILAEKYPHIRLILKDSSSLGYPAVESVVQSVLSSDNTGTSTKHVSKILIIRKSLNQFEMADFYNFIDCYVSPYRAEGFGLTPLEAAGCGTQIILTRMGSTEEYFEAEYMLGVESNEVKKGGKTYREPIFDSLLERMERVLHNPIKSDPKSRVTLSDYVKRNHSWEMANIKLVKLIKRHL